MEEGRLTAERQECSGDERRLRRNGEVEGDDPAQAVAHDECGPLLGAEQRVVSMDGVTYALLDLRPVALVDDHITEEAGETRVRGVHGAIG